jgi:hypothetical protein
MNARHDKGRTMQAGDAENCFVAAATKPTRRLGAWASLVDERCAGLDRHMARNTPYTDWFEGLGR